MMKIKAVTVDAFPLRNVYDVQDWLVLLTCKVTREDAGVPAEIIDEAVEQTLKDRQ